MVDITVNYDYIQHPIVFYPLFIFCNIFITGLNPEKYTILLFIIILYCLYFLYIFY